MGWTCAFCRKENNDNRSQCTVCLHERTPDALIPKNWTCKYCKGENAQSATSCKRCSHSRAEAAAPSAAPVAPPVAPVFASVAPVAPVKAPVTPVAPVFASVAPVASGGNWACMPCGYTKNPPSALFCHSCAKAKPTGKTPTATVLPPPLGDWTCKHCNGFNKASDSLCSRCMHSRPADAASPVKPVVTFNSASSDTWICMDCGDRNPSSSASCARCRRPNRLTPATATTNTSSSSSSNDTWVCSCGYNQNPSAVLFCRGCGAREPSSSSSTAPAPTPSATKTKVTWTCFLCRYSKNPNNAQYCHSCTRQRPANAVTQTTTTTTTTARGWEEEEEEEEEDWDAPAVAPVNQVNIFEPVVKSTEDELDALLAEFGTSHEEPVVDLGDDWDEKLDAIISTLPPVPAPVEVKSQAKLKEPDKAIKGKSISQIRSKTVAPPKTEGPVAFSLQQRSTREERLQQIQAAKEARKQQRSSREERLEGLRAANEAREVEKAALKENDVSPAFAVAGKFSLHCNRANDFLFYYDRETGSLSATRPETGLTEVVVTREVNPQTLRLLAHLPITKLTVGGPNFTAAGLQELSGLSLKSLNLAGSHSLTDKSLHYLEEMPLNHLDLSGCGNLTNQAFHTIGQLPLESLSCSGCPHFTREGFELLPPKLLRNLQAAQDTAPAFIRVA